MKWRDRVRDGIRENIPLVLTRSEFDGRLRRAVDDALLEARNWGDNAANRLRPSAADPFAPLRFDPFDRSILYSTENGKIVLPQEDVFLRKRFRASESFQRIIRGLAGVLESFSGGWMSISGGSGGILSGRDISLEHLFLAQDAAVIKTRSDPHASGIVQNLQYYTIGKGVDWSTPSIEVTSFLYAFRSMNQMDFRERNMVREIFQEGEYFWVYFVDPATGKVKVRKFRPREVTEIETHPEDLETRLAYHRQVNVITDDNQDRWYADINYQIQREQFGGAVSEHELTPNTYIQLSKYGATDDVRGWPPMYSILRYLKYLEDFIVDRARLHHERAKVVWFQQRKGSASRRNDYRSGQLNPLIAPKGGSM